MKHKVDGGSSGERCGKVDLKKYSGPVKLGSKKKSPRKK